MSHRTWTDDMGEISGFGGSYEQSCRDMIEAGLVWFEKHPNATPEFEKYGITKNEDAEELEKAILSAEANPSVAMFGKALSIIRWTHEHSWEEFQEVKRADNKKRETNDG